jgi:hypothetical protein
VATRTLPALIGAGGLLLAGVLALLVVTKGDLVERDGQATTYLVTGRADVPRGLVQDDVVVLSGTVTVEGTVEDDVFVVNGRAVIAGTVHGDVTVLRGNARVAAGAEVGGDLRTSGTPRIADAAVVNGEVESTTVLQAVRDLPRSLGFTGWLMAGLSVLGVGLLLPGRTADAARVGLTRPSRAVALGSVVLVAAPFLGAILVASVLGLGVAVVLGASLVVASAVGAATSGVAVARAVGLRPGPTAFLAGWGALGVALAVVLLISPVLAVLAAGAVVAFGLGALVPSEERVTAPAPEPEPVISMTDEPDDGPQILAAFPIEAGVPN